MISFKSFDRPDDVPGGYAILSHVWRDKEPPFDTVLDLESKGTSKVNFNCEKLANCYRLTKLYGFHYFWTDAPCIDQRNSTELCEAIISMYQWYAKAVICFAHLRDAPSTDAIRAHNSALRNSVYFTRGWTLQELIAPPHAILVSKDWITIGEKEELTDLLEEITGIDADVLAFRRPVSEVSVARCFSWVAHRETRRVVDEAYCLMGLF
ncbi:hypothetical protein C8Q79DRAFT_1055587 [Trametes meyenii]|nr:hypothetical protein C8Q79DRAFT_1055587 [Trametes meyenii]